MPQNPTNLGRRGLRPRHPHFHIYPPPVHYPQYVLNNNGAAAEYVVSHQLTVSWRIAENTNFRGHRKGRPVIYSQKPLVLWGHMATPLGYGPYRADAFKSWSTASRPKSQPMFEQVRESFSSITNYQNACPCFLVYPVAKTKNAGTKESKMLSMGIRLMGSDDQQLLWQFADASLSVLANAEAQIKAIETGAAEADATNVA